MKLVIIIVFPIFCFVILRKHFYYVEDKAFIHRYETIYENLYPLKHTVYLQTPLFCIKRILLAYGAACIVRPVVINIALYIYLSLFTIGYNINNRPMSTRVIQAIENTNEFFILISGYIIILFSNWIFDVYYDNQTALEIGDLPLLRY
jgi:hypothetical protein